MPCFKTLLTGASGFLGTCLTDGLTKRGASVVSVHAGVRGLSSRVRCRLLHQNLTRALNAGPIDVIFHLVGSGVPQSEHFCPREHDWANVATTDALVEAIMAAGYSGRLVFSSSASVYGNTGYRRMIETDPPSPCTAYGRAKACAEASLLRHLAYRCDVRIARIFHAFGPGQRKLVVYDLGKRVIAGERPLIVKGTGHEARDFVFVTDIVRALIFLGLDLPACPTLVNVCSGVATSIRDLALQFLRLDGDSSGEVRFAAEAAGNPVIACVGDPGRLMELGMSVASASKSQFSQTLSWIRRDEGR